MDTPLLQFGALAVGGVELWGANSRRGKNGARVYLYTGAFLLGGPPVCWENGARIYLYARYHFGALVVKAHKLLQ